MNKGKGKGQWNSVNEFDWPDWWSNDWWEDAQGYAQEDPDEANMGTSVDSITKKPPSTHSIVSCAIGSFTI